MRSTQTKLDGLFTRGVAKAKHGDCSNTSFDAGGNGFGAGKENERRGDENAARPAVAKPCFKRRRLGR